MNPSTRHKTRDPAQTMELGSRLAAQLPYPAVLSLEGGLGAGKTVLVKGLARGLGIREQVTSPTFTLVTSYLTGERPLHHVDLYRLADLEEVEDLGLEELMAQRDAITVIEWGEKAADLLPPDALRVRIEVEPDGRVIEIPGVEL